MFDMETAAAELEPESSRPLTEAEIIECATAGPSGPFAISALAMLDPHELDELSQLAVLAAWERQMSWVAAKQQEAVLAVAGAEPRDDDDFAREEVAAALRLSPASAARRISLARALRALPRTAGALESGEIGFLHALAVAEETADLAPQLATEVESALYDAPPAPSLAIFRRRLRAAVLAADPVGADIRHDRARAQREVQVMAEPAGMARLMALLTADEATAVFTALTLAAQLPPGATSPDGIDSRRADALVSLVTGRHDADGNAGDQHGGRGTGDVAATDTGWRDGRSTRREARVTIDLPTLLCLRDGPGELAGYGPISPVVARALAADAEWRLFITDPGTRGLIDRGARCFRPPAALAAFVTGRDGTCRFPGCPRPAVACDLDHCTPHHLGGGTDADNLTPLCRRHHRMKTHAGWHLRREEDATCVWTSPTGAIYRVPLERIGASP